MNKDYVIYPAIFDNKDNDGFYTVTFPDIPDTTTQGKTLAEAFKNAPHAIEVALPDYPNYPTPSDLKEVQAANPNTLVQYIGVDMKRYLDTMKNRSVRKNVTVPAVLAEKAADYHLNFSAVLTEALKERLDS